MAYVYRDDGLMVGWVKDLPRMMLDVEVWQILVDGKKPGRLPVICTAIKLHSAPIVDALLKHKADPQCKRRSTRITRLSWRLRYSTSSISASC